MDTSFKNLFANRRKVMLATLYLAGMLFAWSCQRNMDGNDEELTSLEGTKWKLAGIVDTRTNELRILDPKDCAECYMLTFETDTTYSGHSTSNYIGGIYEVDYKTYAIRFTNVGGTEVNEHIDGKLYVSILWIIQSFSLKEDELRLHYNKKNNYLLYKRQKS